MAQTTVLIGVNPCLTESDLKKQSQFAKVENDVKLLLTAIYGDFGDFERFWSAKKQTQFKANLS